jgi:hypothetical protein
VIDSVKRGLRSFLVLAVILVLFDLVVYWVLFAFGEHNWLYILDFLVKTFILFVLIIGWLYRSAFDLQSRKIIIVAAISLVMAISMAIADRMVALDRFYFYAKTLTKNTSGQIWQFDKKLSYKGIPNSHGIYKYYIGDSIEGGIPLYFDSLGFRTVPDSIRLASDTTDLFLGCSFTFGDYVEAQNTYSYLAAKQLGHQYINGAILGYGAGQMIQITDSLLRNRRFKYVFIQLSEWIVPRAMSLNGPTRFGYRPFPYFYNQGDTFDLALPAYTTRMYSMKNWRKTPRSYPEKILFCLTDGAKIEIHDYYAYLLARIKLGLRMIPAPATDKTRLEKAFFNTMADLCTQHGARPVFLKLHYPDTACRELVAQLKQKATVIDLDSALQRVVLKTGLTYNQLFRIRHYCGNDSIPFDRHPNKFAHAIFANTISQALKP